MSGIMYKTARLLGRTAKSIVDGWLDGYAPQEPQEQDPVPCITGLLPGVDKLQGIKTLREAHIPGMLPLFAAKNTVDSLDGVCVTFPVPQDEWDVHRLRTAFHIS